MSYDVALLPARGSTPEAAVRPRRFLGSYMAFAGVRYYAILDDQYLLEGRHKIGGVGWRLSNMSAQDTSNLRQWSSRAASETMDAEFLRQRVGDQPAR